MVPKGVPSAVVETVRRWCLDCAAGPVESSTNEVQRLQKFCRHSCWMFVPRKSGRQLTVESAEYCQTRGSSHLPGRQVPVWTATGEPSMPLWTWHAVWLAAGGARISPAWFDCHAMMHDVCRPSESEAAIGLCPDEAMEVELMAKNPPPSLVPRIHAVWIKKLHHNNPCLPRELSTGCSAPGELQYL